MTIHRLLSTTVALGLVVVSVRAEAQEFKVQGSSTNDDVTVSTNTATNAQDRRAVHGISTPQANWGIGGQFEGAYIGVRGISTFSGLGNRFAGRFDAGNGAYNYGVYATSPTTAGSYAGYFDGNVYVTGTLTQASDFKLKTNLQDMQGGTLSQVLRLRPKTYRYVAQSALHLNLPTGDQIGFVAQDVAQVFPNLVQEVTLPSTEKGKPDEKFLSVDYIKVIPLLVKALQEQQAQIDALKAQVDALSKR